MNSPVPPATDTLPALLQSLRKRHQDTVLALRHAYEQGSDAEAILHGRAELVDDMLREISTACKISPQVSLAAVGGYGRGELYPCSDVDVLILLPADADAPLKAGVEQFVGALWDVGLEVGHSVRTVDECL